MKVVSESIVFMKDLKILNMTGNDENKIDCLIGDVGCKAILKNAKYITNLEKLSLDSNKD